MSAIVIKVLAPNSARVAPVAVTPVSITPADTARVIVMPAPGPPGPPGAGTAVFGETPTGTKDGTNTDFTLAHTPRPASVAVYRNGLREYLGVGYAESGSQISFVAPPLSSDEITVDYLMEG